MLQTFFEETMEQRPSVNVMLLRLWYWQKFAKYKLNMYLNECRSIYL